jgi:hypothetical protein
MEIKISGWAALGLFALILILSVGLQIGTMMVLAPALANQVEGVRTITVNTERNFTAYNKLVNDGFIAIDKRLKALEKK